MRRVCPGALGGDRRADANVAVDVGIDPYNFTATGSFAVTYLIGMTLGMRVRQYDLLINYLTLLKNQGEIERVSQEELDDRLKQHRVLPDGQDMRRWTMGVRDTMQSGFMYMWNALPTVRNPTRDAATNVAEETQRLLMASVNNAV